MSRFADYILGESSAGLTVATRQENVEATLALTKQCKLKLAIISRELDPFVYDQLALIEAIKKLACRGRNVAIRIIVFEPGLIIQRGHKLLNLAGRGSSFIELRKPAPKYNTFNQAIMAVDDVGYLFRERTGRYNAEVHFNNRRRARHLLQVFNNLWETVEPGPNLRRMRL